MYDIFISYRTTQAKWVEILAHNLKDQGYRVFLDRWELVPGQDFPRQLHQALSEARRAVLVATPDACESGWVQQELQTMIQRKNSGSGFFFIPVVMGQFVDMPFLKTVQAVDFGDSKPEHYRRAFRRLLCGLEQKPPGPDAPFGGELRLPEAAPTDSRPLAQSEQGFLEHIFQQLDFGLPLMILSQADTNTQVYINALRSRSQEIFGRENVLHAFPPNSLRADSRAYFGRLARQCGLGNDAVESWDWAEKMAVRLDAGRQTLLLITGFENGPDESRIELAGELRGLIDKYSNLLLIMMGGRRLAALKYENGDMSLLNFATEIIIPDLDPADLSKIFIQLYPDLKLSKKQLYEVLSFTGGHPRLLHFCLLQGATSASTCRNMLAQSPLPCQLFTPFRTMADTTLLQSYLQQTNLGRFHSWPIEEIMGELYWGNLITRRGCRFEWRCDYIRQTGLELLECCQSL